LGAEHPRWDNIQNVLMLLLFVSLIGDAAAQFMTGTSTILFSAVSSPILVIPAALLITAGYRLITESHRVVLVSSGEAKLIQDGVYSLVRHPMYLGMILFFAGLLTVEFSIVAAIFWLILAVTCNWAASYEERDLERILGDEYREYQGKVHKWIPRLFRKV
jgi:protein-S-isoprenylcysteine O-methyltransferase Ste14